MGFTDLWSRWSRRITAGALALLACVVLGGLAASPASADVTAPLCPGETSAPVDPALLELTGAREAAYENGDVVLLYSVFGTYELTPPLARGDPLPPMCAVHEVDGEPVSSWAFCTDMYAHTCLNNGTPSPSRVTGNEKFDPANDPLGPDKEKVIVYLIQHGYELADPDAGGQGLSATADLATSDNRAALQYMIWCISEAEPGEKTAATSPDDFIREICAPNLDDDDFDALLALVSPAPELTVTASAPTIDAGGTARFTLATNVVGQPIHVAVSDGNGPLQVCGGDPATLRGDQLTVTGSQSQARVVELCAPAAAGATSVELTADVVPTTSDNLVWVWNRVLDSGDGTGCQVFATFNPAVPVQLGGSASVSVQSPVREPETPIVPVTPGTPGTTPGTPGTTPGTPGTTPGPVGERVAPSGTRAPARTARGRLALTKSSRGRTFRVGERIRYVLEVVNRSRRTVRDVRVCDRLPAGVALVSTSPRTRLVAGSPCRTFATLRPGEHRQMTVVVRVLSDAPDRLVNRARATSPDTRSTSARHVDRVDRGEAASRAGGVTG
jgi:uncharacterized repeat protein (TIGR01451 family)